MLMDKDHYFDTLVIKHHLNTATYQKVASNGGKCMFKKLKFQIKNQKPHLTKNEM